MPGLSTHRAKVTVKAGVETTLIRVADRAIGNSTIGIARTLTEVVVDAHGGAVGEHERTDDADCEEDSVEEHGYTLVDDVSDCQEKLFTPRHYVAGGKARPEGRACRGSVPPRVGQRVQPFREVGGVVANDLLGGVAVDEPDPAEVLPVLGENEVAIVGSRGLRDDFLLRALDALARVAVLRLDGETGPAQDIVDLLDSGEVAARCAHFMLLTRWLVV